MMSVGGAIAGGARLAMATSFDPATFWDEVRRYGVTVASYTWTLLHDLVEAPPQPGERHHPVRLFIGSGMPRGLWRRVRATLRSRPGAGVLRLHRDRRDPGQPPRRQAGVHGPAAPGQRRGPDRRLRPRGRPARCSATTASCASAGPTRSACCWPAPATRTGVATTPLRGVFARDDAWLATGDLFRRDADGDYWRLDNVRELIHTAAGPVFTAPIRDALGTLPAVDLAVAYGVPAGDGEHDLARRRGDRSQRLRARRRVAVGGAALAAPGPAPGARARGRLDPGDHVVQADDRARCARRGSPSPGRERRPGTWTAAGRPTGR